jgi:hypothetical protein
VGAHPHNNVQHKSQHNCPNQAIPTAFHDTQKSSNDLSNTVYNKNCPSTNFAHLFMTQRHFRTIFPTSFFTARCLVLRRSLSDFWLPPNLTKRILHPAAFTLALLPRGTHIPFGSRLRVSFTQAFHVRTIVLDQDHQQVLTKKCFCIAVLSDTCSYDPVCLKACLRTLGFGRSEYHLTPTTDLVRRGC